MIWATIFGAGVSGQSGRFWHHELLNTNSLDFFLKEDDSLLDDLLSPSVNPGPLSPPQDSAAPLINISLPFATAAEWRPAETHSALGASLPAASIIPSPGSPGVPANVASTIVEKGDYTIDTGDVDYANNLSERGFSDFVPYGRFLLFDDEGTAVVTNNGVLWNQISDATIDGNSNYAAVVYGKLINNGEITIDLNKGLAFGVYVSNSTYDSDNSLENNGQIFAFVHRGSAFAVETEDFFHPIYNNGLVAAQAETGDAVALLRTNGGGLFNGVDGKILAEGEIATAVEFGRGLADLQNDPQITNEGLIEATSLNPNYASVAILALHLEGEPFQIVNSGTIQGDYAIYSSYDATSSQKAVDIVINEAGGSINGAIFLDLGDDQLTNAGTINGPILMGEGNDTVDNSAGIITAYTDLGFGDDKYVGGSGADYVTGNRGDDNIAGGAGDDLLLGGYGNDALDGGDGSDGIYGEYGNDTITAGRGDYVSAGSGNDRIVLTDFGGFAGIQGGTGFDTLVLAVGTRILDLSSDLAAGRIGGIDDIAMGSGNGLVLRPTDVQELTDANQLEVQGDTSNHIYLINGWAETGQSVVNGITYDVFAGNGGQILIQSGIAVTIGGSIPLGAQGFDPVPTDVPPVPNSEFLASDVTIENNYQLNYSLTIFSNETWLSLKGVDVIGSDSGGVIAGWGWTSSLTNYGMIESDAKDANARSEYGTNGAAAYLSHLHILNVDVASVTGAEAIGLIYAKQILNYGTITATGTGNVWACAFFDGAFGPLTNSGTISATAQNGGAIGVNTWDSTNNEPVLNNGTISAHSDSSFAVGVIINNAAQDFVNNGKVIVSGGAGAIGVLGEGAEIYNNGTITAIGPDSIAIYGGELVNTGTVTADHLFGANLGVGGCYLKNTGHITASIECASSVDALNNDDLINSGTIVGSISYSVGNDTYDGRGGTITGEVFGQDGNDTLLGGAGNEVFDGGAGDDTLNGGGGVDTASYEDATGGVNVSLALSAAQNVGGGAGTDTLISIENLTGSSFNDVLRGNSGNNTLSGGDGNDTLYLSDGGNDVALGGNGNDTFYFAASLTAADTIDGGAGTDTLGLKGNYTGANAVVFAPTTMVGIETINFIAGYSYNVTLNDANVAAGQTLTVNGSGLDATDSLTFDGSHELDGKFVLLGGAGNDVLIGGAGDDTFVGGAGNDTLNGGGGIDTVSYAGASAGVTVNLSNAAAQAIGAGLGNDTLISVENITGSNFNDVLRGSSADNVLSGGTGNDTFDLSDGGNDTVLGDDGNDTINFGGALTATDKIDGGTGSDTAVLNGNYSAGLTFLASTMVNVETLSLAAGHSYNLTLNNGNLAAGQIMTVTGAALGAGDTFHFDGSHEKDGSFIAYGGAGDDVLIGSAGNDTIYGALGNDTLRGGLGADRMIGGAGNDIFVYKSVAESTGSNYDTITGFNFLNGDTIDLKFKVTAIDAAVATGALSTASFDADLAASIDSAHLGKHHAMLYTPDSGDLAGKTFLVIDANGVNGYQAGSDFVIQLDQPTHTTSIDVTDFV